MVESAMSGQLLIASFARMAVSAWMAWWLRLLEPRGLLVETQTVPLMANTGEVFGPQWPMNPIAMHIACWVDVNVPTGCALAGHEENGLPLEFRLVTLPKEGMLYETSPNFRTDGSDPKHMPDPIGPHLLPFTISDPKNRVIYVPPYNVFAPEGFWGAFEYEVVLRQETVDGSPAPAPIVSGRGMAVMANPHGAVVGTNFDLADNYAGWHISGNFAGPDVPGGGLKHQALSWGGLSHYVYGVDEVQYVNFETKNDESKWYFEASDDYNIKELSAAYGGKVQFLVRKLYGNFTQLNDPLDWLTLECASCNNGQGMRLVRFIDDNFFWGGEERLIEVPLLPSGRWMKDPLNSAKDFRLATDCEIASVLTNISRVAILGDFTKGGEGVAIDNVAILAAPGWEQPRVPVECQIGCVCSTFGGTTIRRPNCC
eukprot:TRINITY_DN112685_c0_g1_i1.p1 TRINITY_DN112685_c0_g1~~TRINITY_DN112685_c0_g1_i1.p1  ORF type:complete len:427 (+),score=35.08 TRINITY_DN112685_c0_g1_i1:68-1348(+)